MKTLPETETKATDAGHQQSRNRQPFYSIADLAGRWRCSRATVYNILRGEQVLDFAAPGRKGKKLVPADVVQRIEERRMKVWR